jgi:hypothetical protein
MQNHSFFALVIFVFFVLSPIFAGTYSGGNGQPDTPYQISSPADWQELMATSADWGKYFLMTADIDLAGITLTPVGTSSHGFSGNLEGDSHVIRNITINLPASNYVGLFGCVGNSINNLRIKNAHITGQDMVGIFGYIGSYDYINNINVEDISITGRDYVGGLVGRIYHGSLILCRADAAVTGRNSVGGLVGLNSSGSINACYATGNVSGTSSNVGGLVGSNDYGIITSSYATGDASGNNRIGGLVGLNMSGKVIRCYSTGKPVGVSYVGGLCGSKNNSNGYVDTANFWNTETSQIASSEMGIGKTTVQMKTQGTFTEAGWNFMTVWWLPSDSYPHLLWEKPAVYSGGSGTMEDPFRIAAVDDWMMLINSPGQWKKCFAMTADIDLAGIDL